MKLDEGERLIGVVACTEADDVLLVDARRQCIRFQVDDVRVFTGRTSTGVRGIKLADDDEVISISILRHADVAVEERDAYLRMARSAGAAAGEAVAVEEVAGDTAEEASEGTPQITLSEERFAAMSTPEEFILSVTANGFGKRSSAYYYRVAGRGGSGIANIETTTRNGQVVASFPVGHEDQVMLVTDCRPAHPHAGATTSASPAARPRA